MPSAARQAALGERIRREELRPIEAPSGAIERHGLTLDWTAFAAGVPAVYEFPWGSENLDLPVVTDVADWTAGLPEVTILTAGLWHADFSGSLLVEADVPMDLSHARAALRIMVNGTPAAFQLLAPYPINDVRYNFKGGLALPPTVLAVDDELTVELLPGFGVAVMPTDWFGFGTAIFDLTLIAKLS